MKVERVSGAVEDFLAREIRSVEEAEVWVYAVERPTLVLGSAQRGEVADLRRAAAWGVDVVRRNSGGGAVLLEPDRSIWLDVVLPRHDPRWIDDVVRSAYWLGEVWAEAVATTGVPARVWRHRLEQTAWGRLVCFGAMGPGEVAVGGRKLVGISQRRTRDGARFQCLVHATWDPRPLLDLLLLAPDDRCRAADELADVATGVPTRPLLEAMLSELGQAGLERGDQLRS